MPQAIGHEEAWQAVTLSAKATKTIDSIGVEAAVARIRARGSPRRVAPRSHEVVLLIVPPSWADALPAHDSAESRAGSVPTATTTAAGRARMAKGSAQGSPP